MAASRHKGLRDIIAQRPYQIEESLSAEIGLTIESGQETSHKPSVARQQ